jgi:hypothetical protein
MPDIKTIGRSIAKKAIIKDSLFKSVLNYMFYEAGLFTMTIDYDNDRFDWLLAVSY